MNLVKMLIDAGANITATSIIYVSPSNMYAYQSSVDMNELKKKGVREFSAENIKSGVKKTVLELAFEKGSLSHIKYFV